MSLGENLRSCFRYVGDSASLSASTRVICAVCGHIYHTTDRYAQEIPDDFLNVYLIVYVIPEIDYDHQVSFVGT
jgi:hypothetical protein